MAHSSLLLRPLPPFSRASCHASWFAVGALCVAACGGAAPPAPAPKPAPVVAKPKDAPPPRPKLVTSPSIHSNNPEYGPGLAHALEVNKRLLDKSTVNTLYARGFDAGYDEANELNESYLNTARYRGCKVGAEVVGVSLSYCRAPVVEENTEEDHAEHQGLTDPAFRVDDRSSKKRDKTKLYYGAVHDVGYAAGWRGREREGISDYVRAALVACTDFTKLRRGASQKPCVRISKSCEQLTDAFKRAARPD